MKYRVTKLQEVLNPAYVSDLSQLSKEERKTASEEPEFLYEVDLIVEGHCAGGMSLKFKYVPMLLVGSVYTAQELEEM